MEPASPNPFIRDGVDLRLLARRQRRVCWLIAGNVFAALLVFYSGELSRVIPLRPNLTRLCLAALALLVFLSVWLGLFLLVQVQARRPAVIVALGLIAIGPVFGLVVLLVVNSLAIKTLRKAGLRVGLLGVKDSEVVLRLSENICHVCGYKLTGNTSGRCPECGTLLAGDHFRRPSAGDSRSASR